MVNDPTKTRQRLTINRLTRLIREMPEERQIFILKQLIEGDIASHIIDMINNISYEQQIALLQRLDEIPDEERHIKTIHLDEEAAFMRGHHRKPCLIAADYRVGGQNYKGYILDISSLGVFLETRMDFQMGQVLDLSFKLPNYKENLNLTSEIAWNGRYGIGVKFMALTEEQKNIIRSFVETDEGT
jgi:Tfp pilus assembly protein PilZ